MLPRAAYRNTDPEETAAVVEKHPAHHSGHAPLAEAVPVVDGEAAAAVEAVALTIIMV